jgi:hypothetical protein
MRNRADSFKFADSSGPHSTLSDMLRESGIQTKSNVARLTRHRFRKTSRIAF